MRRRGSSGARVCVLIYSFLLLSGEKHSWLQGKTVDV